MKMAATGLQLAKPALRTSAEIAPYLSWFFTSGRCRLDCRAEVGEGLWPLLRWCWTRNPGKRARSNLCRLLLWEPGFGWRQEDDVLEALARRTLHCNPSTMPAAQVGELVQAFLDEGEAARGPQPALSLAVEFKLPRVNRHPHFSVECIAGALRRNGMTASRWQSHLNDAHVEQTPYRGSWRMTLTERRPSRRADDRAEDDMVRDTIHIQNPAVGHRSRVSLQLSHTAELSAYFRLCVPAEDS